MTKVALKPNKILIAIDKRTLEYRELLYIIRVNKYN